MRFNIAKHVAISALLLITVNASAEGLADRDNEREKAMVTGTNHAHQSMLTGKKTNSVTTGEINSRLKYTTGEALKAYPHFTAQQRKYLVFGND